MNLTEGQARGLEAIQEGGNILLIGPGGSGKSVLQNVAKSMWGYESVFCATTGVANQGLFNSTGGDGTAHTVLSLPTHLSNNINMKNVGRKTSALFSQNGVNRVFIDEAGTLSPDNLFMIDHRIKRFNKPNKTRHARDIQTVLVGDLLQIPTIINGIERDETIKRYNSPLFFKTKAFKDMNFKVVYLDQVMRAEDKEFKYHLDVIRFGVEDKLDDTLAYFNQRVLPAPEGCPMLAIYNKQVEEANNMALRRNNNPQGKYRPVIEGDYNMKNCPADAELCLKKGLPVITLVNHQKGFYQNGSSGVVEALTNQGPMVRFHATKEVHLVASHKFSERESYIDGEETLEDGTKRPLVVQREKGTADHIPIKLAAGMTINKAQGRTLDAPALVDLGGYGFKKHSDFGTAMTYVALSRFTKLEHIFLKHKLTREHIKVCRQTIKWLEDNVPEAAYNPDKYT